jgi:hypothetical protein
MSIRPKCEFCGGPSTLLCDGASADAPAKTCDKQICRACAGLPVALVHKRVKGIGSRCDTRDLCPECRARNEVVRAFA